MKTALLLVSFVIAGCASSPDYDSYLKAQTEANRQAQESQKPLVRLTAQPGQQITGLQSLEVFAPTSMPVIQQARPNEWAAVVGQGLGVLGTVGSIYYGGKAAASLASEVRQAGTAGYAHIQAPGAITTTSTSTTTTNTMSGTGVLGSGTYSTDQHNITSSYNPTTGSYNPVDSTHTPTVVFQPAPVVVTP